MDMDCKGFSSHIWEASTGYLPLPRETQTAAPSTTAPLLQLFSDGCPAQMQTQDPCCHFLPVSSWQVSGHMFQSSSCIIYSDACKHLFRYPTLWNVWLCHPNVLPECTGFSFSCLNSALIHLWAGLILLKPRKNLVSFPYFKKPQP